MDGPRLLRAFMRTFDLKLRHVADALGVTKQAVSLWLAAESGADGGNERVPRARQRKAIAIWTTARDPVTGIARTWVPEGAWDTEEDRLYLASIQPFEANALREAA